MGRTPNESRSFQNKAQAKGLIQIKVRVISKLALGSILFFESKRREKSWRTIWSNLPTRPYGRAFVHLSTRSSSEYLYKIDGLSSSIVHLCPSRTNNHGLSSEFVHEVDGLSSSGCPPPSFYAKQPWSVVRFRSWDGRSIRSAVHLRPPSINYHDPSSKSVHATKS